MQRQTAPAEQSWHAVAQSGQGLLSTYVKRFLLRNAKEQAKAALVVNYYNTSSEEYLPKVWIKACTAVCFITESIYRQCRSLNTRHATAPGGEGSPKNGCGAT